ncbi:hypothetical protein M7802_24275, partial [Enterobacter hormaechei subsp. xiangfangensis]|uniref:hypothetical protein n=1 Tax=Enterobacter hormaechei TaxID=158836 RepID=UPI002237CB0A
MNVHLKYDTIKHYHFDWLTPAGDYPNSAVMLVGFRDGRWIIVQEFGNDYSCFEGVLKNGDDLNTEPKFYSDLGNDSNLLIVFYVQIMPDDFVMQLHR